jgi:hypothetical protein
MSWKFEVDRFEGWRWRAAIDGIQVGQLVKHPGAAAQPADRRIYPSHRTSFLHFANARHGDITLVST